MLFGKQHDMPPFDCGGISYNFKVADSDNLINKVDRYANKIYNIVYK